MTGTDPNAFVVLACDPEASTAELRRSGARLLGELQLGIASARSFVWQGVEVQRDESMVRRALALVGDPERCELARQQARAIQQTVASARDFAPGASAADTAATPDPEAAAARPEPPRLKDVWSWLGYRTRW